MIVNDINEYVSLNVLQNYCSMHGGNCEECKLRDLCDCMASSPESWSLVFEGEKDEKAGDRQEGPRGRGDPGHHRPARP